MFKPIQEAWSQNLYVANDGQYPEYRIPGVVVTNAGTILCYCEARTSLRDDWDKIDIILSRSDDDGSTWTRHTLCLPESLGGTQRDTLNNPTLIVDGELIHLIFHQNYARAFYCQSTDDGKTWSLPVEITDAFREFPYEWNVCATGPGHGLRAQNGRLIAPIWVANGEFEDPQGLRRAHEPSIAGAIYSDDRGATWHAAALVENLPDANETTLAQRSDGSILYNFRTRFKGLRRTLGISPDGVSGFSRVWICDALPDPMCFGGMTNLSDGAIAFVNCSVGVPDTSTIDQFVGEDGRTARINLSRPEYGSRTDVTVKVSRDDGETWEKIIDVDPVGGYADIAVHGDCLYVFYEHGPWSRRVIERLTLKKYRLAP